MKRMKIDLAIIVASLLIITLLSIPMLASAAEKMIDAKVTDIVTKLDKNGVEYTRAIIQESRKLQGVEYTVGVPVMGFGDQSAVLKTYRTGQNLKAIVSSNEYKGRTSYTVIAVLDKMD